MMKHYKIIISAGLLLNSICPAFAQVPAFFEGSPSFVQERVQKESIPIGTANTIITGKPIIIAKESFEVCKEKEIGSPCEIMLNNEKSQGKCMQPKIDRPFVCVPSNFNLTQPPGFKSPEFPKKLNQETIKN